MPPDNPVASFTSLCADQVLPATPVPPCGQPRSLPRYRLNMLATDGTHLYHPLSRDFLGQYRIERPYNPTLVPCSPVPISPPTTINNINISHVPDANPKIIMTGGHELNAVSGTFTVYDVGDKIAQMRELPVGSAWGLAAHRNGLIAITSNSASGLVVNLRGSQHEPVYLAELHAHADNIPCAHFSPCGSFVASASIDSSFAIYHARSGRLLFHSAEMMKNSSSPRSDERCWAVHWMHQSIAVQMCPTAAIWKESIVQRHSQWSLPHNYSGIFAERNCFFDGMRKVATSASVPLYDDRSPVEGPQTRRETKKRIRSSLPQVTGTNAHAFAAASSEIMPGPAEEQEKVSSDRDYLMLICHVETIYLCQVWTSGDARDGSDARVRVKMIDAIRLKTGRGQGRQIMITNVIDVPQLNVVIVTAVNAGVIILRILQPTVSSEFEVLHDVEHVSRTPMMFIEKVITPESDSVIGTCVVERAGECKAAQSFELWIMTQDGMVECWDLRRDDLALDPSTTL